jgi:hypothetical protein
MLAMSDSINLPRTIYYLFYKHKVCGPYTEMPDQWVTRWKLMVDTGLMRELPDTDFMNQNMRDYPNDVHVIVNHENSHIWQEPKKETNESKISPTP